MRDKARSPLSDEHDHGGLCELPAASSNPANKRPKASSAPRELLEELGFEAEKSQLPPLGPSTLPAAGIVCRSATL